MKRSHLETTERTVQRIWTAEDIPVLQASAALPEPQSAKGPIARRIRRYYQLQSRLFLRYCETQLYPYAVNEYHAALSVSGALPAFQARMSYQITWNSGGILSLYTQLQETTLPGRTHLRRWGDTWDLHSGYLLSLPIFFPPRYPWKKQLLHMAEETISQQEAAGTAKYHENRHRALRRHFNPRNYYLTEEGLVFFYPMYAIAPAEERIPTFCVPPGTGGLLLPGTETDDSSL
jgi:hypothetical protein